MAPRRSRVRADAGDPPAQPLRVSGRGARVLPGASAIAARFAARLASATIVRPSQLDTATLPPPHRARDHHLPPAPGARSARGHRHRPVRPASTAAPCRKRKGPEANRAQDDGRAMSTTPAWSSGRSRSTSNEIPRACANRLDLTGRIVIDPMHAQHETARCLLDAAHYVSAIKDNQETILEDLRLQRCPWHETLDKGHGRIERRRCAVVDLTAAEWDGYANLHGRRQAMRIEREREVLNTAKRSIEVTWSLPRSVKRRTRGAARLGRNHHISALRARLQVDEDRCRRRLAACLTTRPSPRALQRPLPLPAANRHYAARSQEALDAILTRPSPDPAGITAQSGAPGRAAGRRGATCSLRPKTPFAGSEPPP